MFCRFMILTVSLVVVPFETRRELCVTSVKIYTSGFAAILSLCAFLEMSVVWMSLRGTIIHRQPRSHMPCLVYGRLGTETPLFLPNVKAKQYAVYIAVLA